MERCANIQLSRTVLFCALQIDLLSRYLKR
jgi:hypothetical protein